MKKILLYITLCLSINLCFSQSEDNMALIKKGNALFKAGLFEKANTYYSKAITNSVTKDSLIIEAYFNRAYGNLFLNNKAKSLADLNTILSINPNLAKVYFLRSKLHLHPELKVKDLEKAHELDPTNQDYLEKLAITKISIVANRFDEIREHNDAKKEQLMQELFYASGGCDLLKTLNKSEAELKSLLQKYCSLKEVSNF